MAVKRTPWSSTTTFGSVKPIQPKVVNQKPKVSDEPSDPFAQFRENKAELDKAVRSTIDRILTDKSLLSQPEAEKDKMIQQVLDIAYGGKDKPDKPSGIKGIVKGIAQRAVLGPLFAGAEAYNKVVSPVQRTVQSGAIEFTEALAQFFAPQTLSGQKLTIKSKDKSGQYVPVAPSWEQFVTRAKDPDWMIGRENWYNGGKADANRAIELSAAIATDPLTYAGVGATANIGRGAKTALAAKIVDNATVAKYPELAALGKEGLDTLASQIIRKGAVAIPKTVREGEGIQIGLRYMGKIIPKTEAVELAWSKTAGSLRAGIGDIVFSPKNPVGRVITPRAVRGLVDIGAGRRAGQIRGNVRDELAIWTATKNMKGRTASAYRIAVSNVKGFAERQNELMGRGIKGKLPSTVYEPEAANLYKYIEMSPAELAVQPVKQELKDLATDIKAWQDSLRESTNKSIREFGNDFSTSIRQIGFVDDYIHHQMTPEARRWIAEAANRKYVDGKGGFRSSDIVSKDLTNPQAPLMFRRLRGQYVDPATGALVEPEFFGRKVVDGTIDEINRIFREETGSNFDWFETDFVKVADSYAYSMAKAQGRAAFARRLMDFGHDDLIKPLIKESVPDEKLVKLLTDVHSKTMLVRERLRASISVHVKGAKNYAEQSKNLAAKFLKGELKTIKLAQKEYAALNDDLADAVFRLSAAHTAASQTADSMRGDFHSLHQVLRDEISTLSGAINDPARFAATEELKAVYMQIFPNHNPVLLDSKSPEWIAEKILHANGVPAVREIEQINIRLGELRGQIDDIPVGGQYDEIRAALEADYYDLEQVEQAFSQLGIVRMEADYSADGFMYGGVDDLIPLPDDEVFKVFRTNPQIIFGDGYRELPDAVAVHAIPSGALLDMRRPAHFEYIMSDEGIISGVADSLYRRGFLLEAEGLREQATLFFRTGAFDPQWEQTYPEMANFIANVKLYGATGGDDYISDTVLTASLYDIEEALSLALPVSEFDDVDILVREVMQEALGRVNQNYDGASGILIPQGWWDDLSEDVPDYVVMVDPSYRAAQPSLNPADSSQFVNGNRFVQDIMDGRYEEVSLETSLAKTAKEEQLIELENSQILLPDLADEAKRLASKKGGITRAAKARVAKTEKALETLRSTDSVEIVRGGKKIVLTREQAQNALLENQKKFVKDWNKLQKEIDAVYEAAGVSRDLSAGPLVDAVSNINERLPMLFNQAEVMRTWSETTGQFLAKDIQDMRQLIASAPPKGAAGGEAAAWARKVDRTIEQIGGFEDPAVAEAYQRVTTLLHADEAQLALIENISLPSLEQDIWLASSGALGARIVETTQEGWSEIYGLGVQVPDEVINIWKPRLERLLDPDEWGAFVRAYKYTLNFFKVYATSTVGFFVRNGMGATFMNYVAGVSTDNIMLGVRAAHAVNKGPQAWEKFLAKQTPAMAQLLEEAYRATLATGKGFSDQLAGLSLRGKGTERIINNRYTRFYQRRNEGVEMGVRLPMAIDSFRRGQNFDQAVARISRYHFDYSDLSALDEAAKSIIPFWIWTSRNVPLQIVEQWVNPQPYISYQRIKESSPVDDKIMMPKWIADWKPAAISGVNAENGQWVITPDTPINQLDKQLQSFTTSKIAGQLAPVFKLPLELIAGRQLGIDVGPFKTKQQPAKGLDEALAPLASLLAGEELATQDPQTGEWKLDERVPYILQNILPTLGQVNRVTGGLTGGKPTYQERQLGNIANWFGVPIRYVGPQQQASEAVGRQFEIRDLIAQWIEQNKLTKKR